MPNQYVPVRMNAGVRDVIDFVDSPVTTPLDSVVGGPPAYLESHGIRYVPEAAPADLRCADEPPTIAPLSAADGGGRVTQQELDARVDARVRKYMQESGALPMASRAAAGPDRASDRLRRLRDCVEDMAEEHDRSLRAAPAPAPLAAQPRAPLRGEGVRTRSHTAVSRERYDY
jgi:hypothetical protein